MSIPRSALTLAVLATAAVAGCASQGPSATTAAHTARTASPPTCLSKLVTWRTGGGLTPIQVLTTDLSAFQKAELNLAAALEASTGLSDAETAVQSAAASLQSDATAAEANLPPACVPHLRQDLGAALTDYTTTAIDADNTVGQIGNGDYATAAGDVQAATTEMQAGNAKTASALADLNAFNAG